ncbi:MAG: HD-GYP domain-containing protein [Holophagaceae bacterium]|nr:HD-GYP domain-containing protein [Holophagaceae bacterium]
MIKKVKTSNLKVGMYIHDLNVPWLEHGFAKNRFLIQDEQQIAKMVQVNISEVLIDTVRGIDEVHSPSMEEAESELMGKMIDVASGSATGSRTGRGDVPLLESRKVHFEAVKVVSDILGDVRIGKQVNVEQATPVVSNITEAVLQNDGTLVSLCRIKHRDTYTFQHSVSISALLVTFCNSVGGFSGDQLIDIGLGGLFHDIGKMRIPDEILNKPGRLTEDEFAVMRSHVTEGVNYLNDEKRLSESAIKIVGEHHERFDGTGYPKGLARKSISEIGQMTSIVDVYDAITSIRVYHSALEPSDALKRIFEWSGKHFEEGMVQRFIKAIGIYPVGSLVRLESDHLAVVLRQGESNMLTPLVRIVFDAKTGHRLLPKNLDLAAPNCQNQIAGYEIPSKWGIDPIQFVGRGL